MGVVWLNSPTVRCLSHRIKGHGVNLAHGGRGPPLTSPSHLGPSVTSDGVHPDAIGGEYVSHRERLGGLGVGELRRAHRGGDGGLNLGRGPG